MEKEICKHIPESVTKLLVLNAAISNVERKRNAIPKIIPKAENSINTESQRIATKNKFLPTLFHN